MPVLVSLVHQCVWSQVISTNKLSTTPKTQHKKQSKFVVQQVIYLWLIFSSSLSSYIQKEKNHNSLLL